MDNVRQDKRAAELSRAHQLLDALPDRVTQFNGYHSKHVALLDLLCGEHASIWREGRYGPLSCLCTACRLAAAAVGSSSACLLVLAAAG